MTKVDIKQVEPDYIHSSNTVFSFMKKAEYLEKALVSKYLSPRYCEENIEYLNLMNDGKKIRTISVLQKCFCDIPLHRIATPFPLTVTTNPDELDDEIWRELSEGNTHTDFYGEYGIAFSKNWAQEHNLQPVQYVNPKSAFAEQFMNTFECVLNQDDISDKIVSDIVSRLNFFKPLYGEMSRSIDGKSINFLKNFYDECEWRFVPKIEDLEKYQMTSVMFKEEAKKLNKDISNRLENEKYKEVHLNFELQDIRYLIVPDNEARINLINYIMNLEIEDDKEKYLLISKILVLKDIKKDF